MVKRDRWLTVRLSEAEFKRLFEFANKQDRPVSIIVRDALKKELGAK